MTSRTVLEPDKILRTIDALSRRIDERFPESGLYAVCRHVHGLAGQAGERSEWISRPLILLRIVTLTVVVSVLAGGLVALLTVLNTRERDPDSIGFEGFVTVLEAGVNIVVLIGAAVLFLLTLETRIKRRRALHAIHEIRSVAHIIDMHQLTMDPERLRFAGHTTASSPVRLRRFELGRYLDYCSELLSLASKVAAVYVQRFDDPVSLASANELESLCTGLSRKIWQKIMILQTLPEDGQSPLPADRR